MNETKHDYHNCIVGNFYEDKCTGVYDSWEEFKNNFLAFISEGYDEIKKLKEDKQNLIVQLVDMEELKGENKRLKEQLSKLKK